MSMCCRPVHDGYGDYWGPGDPLLERVEDTGYEPQDHDPGYHDVYSHHHDPMGHQGHNGRDYYPETRGRYPGPRHPPDRGYPPYGHQHQDGHHQHHQDEFHNHRQQRYDEEY